MSAPDTTLDARSLTLPSVLKSETLLRKRKKRPRPSRFLWFWIFWTVVGIFMYAEYHLLATLISVCGGVQAGRLEFISWHRGRGPFRIADDPRGFALAIALLWLAPIVGIAGI